MLSNQDEATGDIIYGDIFLDFDNPRWNRPFPEDTTDERKRAKRRTVCQDCYSCNG